jgi:hypothetical protein
MPDGSDWWTDDEDLTAAKMRLGVKPFSPEAEEHFPGCTFPKGDHTAACRADFEKLAASFTDEVDVKGGAQ